MAMAGASGSGSQAICLQHPQGMVKQTTWSTTEDNVGCSPLGDLPLTFREVSRALADVHCDCISHPPGHYMALDILTHGPVMAGQSDTLGRRLGSWPPVCSWNNHRVVLPNSVLVDWACPPATAAACCACLETPAGSAAGLPWTFQQEGVSPGSPRFPSPDPNKERALAEGSLYLISVWPQVCCVISWKKPLFCRLSRRLLLKGIHNQRRDMETHRRKRQLCEDGGRG
ncbi:uncharacterized protein [Manis javanica]|uniref:uncharacterized protein isoform X1 n=1 Tax=Manis javanica TaxID=9974 RepID=UPI00187A7FFE|nr:uncharacterized protein LOC118972347 isoform X1 [Manis javanica]XP_036873819.1 uncharacterized protein LOC118972347 isoform X1 [Manis javanica]